MKQGTKEERKWRQLLGLMVVALVVGSGLSIATKMLAPAVIQAKTPLVEIRRT